MTGYELENVCFSYTDTPVIDSVSVAFNPGKFYGIIGPNGCGKTTLADLLIRHRVPVNGTIRFRGKGLERFSRRELAREMALVPQDFAMNFSYTAGDIVMMGRYPWMPRFAHPSEEDLKVVRNVMEATDTAQFRHRFVTELSGGERQRVVFARALAQQAPVLILDEATSNLDIHHSLSLLDLAVTGVREEGRTVIGIFQDINLAAAFCDDLLFMKDGKVSALGPIEEVLSPEIIRDIFNAEAKVFFDDFADARQVVFRRP